MYKKFIVLPAVAKWAVLGSDWRYVVFASLKCSYVTINNEMVETQAPSFTIKTF